MAPHLGTIYLAWLLALGQPQAPPAPTAEEVRRAIADLGDDRFAVREKASEFLWKAGRTAEAALREAERSSDPEVASRARKMMENFRYGLYPDTPPKVAEQIVRFRRGDPSTQWQALEALQKMGELGRVLSLVELTSDENLRRSWRDRLAQEAARHVPPLLVEGKYDEAEKLLRFAADANVAGIRSLAAFWLLRGRLDVEITELAKGWEKSAEPRDGERLAYCLRAKGDLAGAVRVAEKLGDRALIQSLVQEAMDWKKLAALAIADPSGVAPAKAAPGGAAPGGLAEIERLGLTAAYHRLAGNKPQFAAAVTEIKKHAAAHPTASWPIIEALTINEQFDDAFELMHQHFPAHALNLRIWQLRHREGFKIHGLGSPRGPFPDWFKAPAAAGDKVARRPDGEFLPLDLRFTVGIQVARELKAHAQKATAEDLYRQLANHAKGQAGDLLLTLAASQPMVEGSQEQAFEHIALALEKNPSVPWISKIFPARTETAQLWWSHLSQRGRPAALRSMQELLLPGRNRKSADELTKILDEATQQAESQMSADNAEHRVALARWLRAMGETAQLHGHRELARRFLRRAADIMAKMAAEGDKRVSPEPMLQYADLCALDGRWVEAADGYVQAWEHSQRRSATALYLKGHALEKQGKTDEARTAKALARLLPLADERERQQLGSDLFRRGMKSEADAEWQLALRLGGHATPPWYEALRLHGDAISATDPFQAAAAWELYELGVLRLQMIHTRLETYVTMRHAIHGSRARGHLLAGRLDQALAEIRLAEVPLPNAMNLTIEMVPLLEQAGRRDAADELFQQAYDARQKLSEDYPDSARACNFMAWLAARCGRKLDDALELSNKSLRLDPDNPSYLSTLAEVRFQRGERDVALRLIKRCLEMDPSRESFQEQWKRMSSPQ